MGFLTRLGTALTVLRGGIEGQYRPGPWYLPITGGWLPQQVGQYTNWWQLGYDPVRMASGAIVEACIGAYSQTISTCPGDHWRSTGDGGRERVTNSALSRILRFPNSYQSPSDFLLNATRSLYLEGNAFALALRNSRFEITELHLMRANGSGAVIAQTGDIFYNLGGNPIVAQMVADGGLDPDLLQFIPARDVLHIRLHTPSHPLRGETPLCAALSDMAASSAMTQQQIAFYSNQARPSFILQTDKDLRQDQIDFLRAKWNEQSQGLNAGGTAILTHGLKPMPLSTSGRDAELANMMKLTDEHVALVFRIPLQILGIGPTPFASTEVLMQAWIASGLGFAINHIEEAFGKLFQLRGVPDEYVEFDTSILLRSAEKDRIDALAASVKGGIRTINEARARESLPAVEGGDDIRVQQQDVPLNFHEQQSQLAQQQAQAAADNAAAVAAQSPPQESPQPAKELIDAATIRRRFRSAYNRHAA